MARAMFLDTGPLGLVTQRSGVPEADKCRKWALELNKAGIHIFVAEIADYEIRRELIRAGRTAGITRLDSFLAAEVDRYVPITTEAMRRAAELWAHARNTGFPTADPHALDADVILAAQVLTWCEKGGVPSSEIMVASVNVRHIARYIPSDVWRNIRP